MSFLTLSLIMMAGPNAPIPTVIHEADCPYCKLPVVQNTSTFDNEVVVKLGNKKIEYRCLYCVIKDQKRFKADLIVYSPSEKIGEPVVLKRTAGKWTGPKDAVFLNTFKSHSECAGLSRAFLSKQGFDKYVAEMKVEAAKPLTLDALLEQIAQPTPEKDGQSAESGCCSN